MIKAIRHYKRVVDSATTQEMWSVGLSSLQIQSFNTLKPCKLMGTEILRERKQSTRHQRFKERQNRESTVQIILGFCMWNQLG